MTCGVTVLRCAPGRFATKKWSWSAGAREWRPIGYEAGGIFETAEHEVANLTELAAVLDDVRCDPRLFVVRGKLTEAAKAAGRGVRRKLLKNGIAPTLLEVPRRWLMVDIDKWPLRPMDDLAADPELAIEAAIHALLPTEFHNATCWWQLSSSAGFIAGVLKAHLFFWLTEPATNVHIKAVLKQHAPDVDGAPFNAAQPHYVADPIIEGGYDPLPRRTGWRHGIDEAVTLPALRPIVRGAAPTASTGGSATVDGALARLGHGEGGNGFHEPLRAATLAYARTARRDDDHEPIKITLRAAIRNAPCRSGGDVEPYCADHYLDSFIDGAFAYLEGRDLDIRSMRPHYAAPTATMDEARVEILRHVTGFLDRVLAGAATPEHAGLRAVLGGGKTSTTISELARFIAAAKAAGKPYRVLMAVPTHRLGNDLLAKMQRLGLNVEAYRGRRADVPGTNSPEPDEFGETVAPTRMCINLDAVRDAHAIRASIETAVCGPATPGKPCCPWRTGADQCQFQQQKPRVARADVVVVAHQVLFHALPKFITADLACVIVDESWWQAGLPDPRDLDIGTFAKEPLAHPVRRTNVYRVKVPDNEGTADLHDLARKAQRAFEQTKGFVTKALVESTGLTASECKQAGALEWARMVEGVVVPGMTAKARRDALKQAAGNAVIPTRAAVWKALAELLEGDEAETGRLEVASATLTVHSRYDIRPEIAALPMLMLDATLPIAVVEHFLPDFKLLADVQAATPHMQVTQVVGGFGKTTLVPHPKKSDAENKHRRERVAELADFAGLHSGGNALAVTYEGIEAAFKRPGVRTGHFNAIAGLDEFRDVLAAFIIGRPFPDSAELRRMALALAGRPIADETGQFEIRGALMADGTGQPLKVRCYADPILEALRAAITDAEVTQAIGRVRGGNRNASNPVHVFVLADVLLTTPVNRMVAWATIRPNVVQRMAARGVVLTSCGDAYRCYPDLFVSVKAAEHAIGRWKATGGQTPMRAWSGSTDPHSPMLVPTIGEWGPVVWTEATYQPQGERLKPRQCCVVAERLDGLAEWLTERLGVPVRVLTPPPPTPPVEVTMPEPPPTPAPPRQPLWQEPAVTGLFRVGAARVVELDGDMQFKIMPARPPPMPLMAAAD